MFPFSTVTTIPPTTLHWRRFLRRATLLALLAFALSHSARAEERILWYSIGDGMTNTTNLQNAINFAVANNFNAICVLGRYRANAYYLPNRNDATFANPEPAVSGAAGDTLQFAIDRGRAAGLRVYASFVCFMVTDGSDTFPAHLPAGSTSWVYNDTTGASNTTYNPDAGSPRPMVIGDNDGEGLWVEPGIAAVRTYTRNVLKDLVTNYDLDGIIFDRIRYPGEGFPIRTKSFGYNPTALSEMGLTNPAPGNAAFLTARRNAISTFITDAYADVTAIKPWMIVGAAPIIYGTNLNETYSFVFQHFPTWNNAVNPGHTSGFGNLDIILPQYYRTTAAANGSLMDLVNADIDETARIRHGATFASYLNSGDIMANNICLTRSKNMAGHGFFSYTSANVAGYMTTLNGTNAAPCGTNVMGAASPKTQFTLKTGWDSVPPNAATNFTATPAGAQINLAWTAPAPAGDGDSASRYLIYRGLAPNINEYYANLVTVNTVSGTTLIDTPPNGTYYYRIVPVDDYNNHGPALETGPVTVGTDEVLLSDFGASVDGWSGTINGNTPFANGTTAVSRVTESGDGVLNLSDAGFGGGASRTYTNVAGSGSLVTVVADMKIVTDPGNLNVDVAFGIKAGSGVGTSQQFAYSRSIGTAAIDSGQSFTQVAAAVFLPTSPSDIVAAVTPDKIDWSVAGGTWEMRLDNVKVASSGTVMPLSDFTSTGVDSWVATSAGNSPFAAGSTVVGTADETGNAVLRITDSGFGAGAVRNYTGAAAGPGIHTVLADVRIVTDPGTLVQARLAAAPGGFTTTYANLSWSESFATAADDSNQAFRTVAIPVITSGISDVAVYLFPDFDASVATGAWEIRVDNVRIVTEQQVPVGLSSFELE